MKKFNGLSLEDVVLKSAIGYMTMAHYGPSELLVDDELIKTGIKFGHSVLAREMLHRMKYHPCDSCDLVSLSLAEVITAKRQLNTRALGLMTSRFALGASSSPDLLISDKTLPALGSKTANAAIFKEWVPLFMDATVDLLHGGGTALDLFGDTQTLEVWNRYIGNIV